MKIAVPLVATLLSAASAAASSLKPPVLPLAVRNPYLSMWYNARRNPWDTWPMFWTGAQLGVGIMAQTPKDSKVYSLLGRPQDALNSNGNYTYTEAVFNGFQFDSSSTSLKYTIGGNVNIELLWTSPITGDSMMRQSIPATYLEIKVSGSQDVNIYMDVNGMWSTGDRAANVVWDYTKPTGAEGLQSWLVQKQTQMLFTENSDRGEWGNFYFTAPEDSSITYQSTESGPMRRQFASTGVLNNDFDQDWRTVLDREPAFAYVKNFPLSSNSTAESSVLYTLALVQDPITQFASATGYRAMEPLWKSYYDNDAELLQFHYSDYKNASASAAKLSEKIATEATELVSDTYADIAALSARQVMGATYFSGTPDDPILFLKEISSNGNFQTVDVIFPAFPFLLYVNPDWVAYLLEPLLEHQMAGLYPNLYSIHDLGSHFPNATGHSDGNDEPMPVEESGNMLIMALAYIRRLGEMRGADAVKEWVNREGRYHLWTQWTQFLIDKGLIPDNQLSTDDFAGTLQNQTNLAVKALIGIRAMSQISDAVDNTTDAEKYLAISDDYLPKWQDFAISRDGTHTKLAYHWYGSWGSLYNQYADALLCFHLEDATPAGPYFSHETYRNQSIWYHNVHQKYGLPLDSRHLYTKSDWEMWTAAISSPATRDEIIGAMGTWLNETTTDRAFTDLYDTESGGFPGIFFMARPVAGGHFSILTLNSVCDGRGYSAILDIYSSASNARMRDIDVEKSLAADRAYGESLGVNVDAVLEAREEPIEVQRWRDAELKR